MNLKQEGTESIEDYMRNSNEVAYRCGNEYDNYLRMSLNISGLQTWICKLAFYDVDPFETEPRTFEEALNIAREHGDSIRGMPFSRTLGSLLVSRNNRKVQHPTGFFWTGGTKNQPDTGSYPQELQWRHRIEPRKNTSWIIQAIAREKMKINNKNLYWRCL